MSLGELTTGPKRLTHTELAKKLGDMVRAHRAHAGETPSTPAALEEAVRTWWVLHLVDRHYDDLSTIARDLKRIDELIAPDSHLADDERVFLQVTRGVLNSEKCRHESALMGLIEGLGGRPMYTMLAALFPFISEYVHIEQEEK